MISAFILMCIILNIYSIVHLYKNWNNFEQKEQQLRESTKTLSSMVDSAFVNKLFVFGVIVSSGFIIMIEIVQVLLFNAFHRYLDIIFSSNSDVAFFVIILVACVQLIRDISIVLAFLYKVYGLHDEIISSLTSAMQEVHCRPLIMAEHFVITFMTIITLLSYIHIH